MAGNTVSRPQVICLMGPTASGKTDIAIELSEQQNCELVSVDSAMVYRGMDIGTAKPDAETLQRAPHRLVDILDPWESYSAGDFCNDAVTAINEIIEAGKTPLLVGGTMMYFHALQVGMAELPEADAELRKDIDARAAESGWPALHAELAERDPEAAEKIRPNDAQRIQRALEVIYLSGEKISVLQQDTRPPIEAEFLNVGIMPADRGLLHSRIEQRFELMLEQGFEQEVRGLLALPEMSPNVPAMRAVGYRQMLEYINGETDIGEATRRAVVATRRLAKRQMTWLRSMPQTRYVDIGKGSAIEAIAELFPEAGDKLPK